MGSIPVILNGPGRVGLSFVRLLEEKAPYIRDKTGVRPSLVAVTDVDRSLFNPEGLSLVDVRAWKAPVQNASYRDILDRVAGIPRVPGIPGVRGISGIVVEATPTNPTTGEPGLSHIVDAISLGFSVVTLAKGPLVVAFHSLRGLASEKGAGLKYSGAVAAALPTVDTAMYSMAGVEITEIEGVLNGTTNYILNSMANGTSYSHALSEAQAMGVAEANPTLDVEGFDSAAKLLIIANTVWGTSLGLSDVRRQGITHLDGQEVMEYARGGTPVRLVARAWLDPEESGATSDAGFADSAKSAEPTKPPKPPKSRLVHLAVGPEPLPAGHPFMHLPGTQKAVRFVSREMGDIVVSGGASDVVGAAASAVKDLIHLLEERRTL